MKTFLAPLLFSLSLFLPQQLLAASDSVEFSSPVGTGCPIEWTCEAGSETDYATARIKAENSARACNPRCIDSCRQNFCTEALIYGDAQPNADRNLLYTWRSYCRCI